MPRGRDDYNLYQSTRERITSTAVSVPVPAGRTLILSWSGKPPTNESWGAFYFPLALTAPTYAPRIATLLRDVCEDANGRSWIAVMSWTNPSGLNVTFAGRRFFVLL